MPYKDLERKKEWERLHRAERLARRRQLRQIEADLQEAQPMAPEVEVGAPALLIPVIAGGALAAYNPKLGLALGGLTLASSAIFKKRVGLVAGGVGHSLGVFVFLLERYRNKVREHSMKVGSGEMVRPKAVFVPHQLAFDNGKRYPWEQENEPI